MREFITITLIAIALLLAALYTATYFAANIGFTATEVEHETTTHCDNATN